MVAVDYLAAATSGQVAADAALRGFCFVATRAAWVTPLLGDSVLERGPASCMEKIQGSGSILSVTLE